MTEALAGPYCAMLLGDLGADVVKVERPKVGDQARSWGPPFLEGESAYFLGVKSQQAKRRARQQGRGRFRSAATTHRAGRRLSHQQSADRFARTQRLDPATLRGRDPRLVYAAISGYGHFGPKANRGGYDIIAQGEAGLMALTGPAEGGPSRFPSPMADISGGSTRASACSRRCTRAIRVSAERARANSSTSRSSTRRRAGSRTSARATSQPASGPRGSAMHIRP
jgi:hypothetical protein